MQEIDFGQFRTSLANRRTLLNGSVHLRRIIRKMKSIGETALKCLTAILPLKRNEIKFDLSQNLRSQNRY